MKSVLDLVKVIVLVVVVGWIVFGVVSSSGRIDNNSSQLTASSSNPATTPETKSASVQPTTPHAITPGAESAIDRSAFQSIDQYVLGTPSSAAKSLDSLAAYLVKPAKNDFEKARAIYRWITQNISYDFSAYQTKSYGSTHAVDVLTSRSSVCAGYSGLFYYLARSARLEVVSISGWAKGYGYNAGDQINGRTNHAWNAVKINGGWYLIDSTWGAGHIYEQRFVREFDEAYFLTPPDQFIFNHLPEDSKWQLLNKPLTQHDFSALPYVNQNFFKYGLNLGNNNQSIINAKDSLSMTFPVPKDTYLMAGLSLGNTKLAKSFATAQRVGNQYQINATLPYPCTSVLSIFARKNDEYGGPYSGVLEYKVVGGGTPLIKQTTPNETENATEKSTPDIPDDFYVQVSNDAYYYEGTSGEYCTYMISVHNKHATWSLRNVRLILIETGQEYDMADLIKPYDTVTFNRNKLLCSKFKVTWTWQPPSESK
jgi:hypothetical protein